MIGVDEAGRDKSMEELDENYSGYNLRKHKGCGNAQHRKALKRLG
jgi:ribonuclease HII